MERRAASQQRRSEGGPGRKDKRKKIPVGKSLALAGTLAVLAAGALAACSPSSGEPSKAVPTTGHSIPSPTPDRSTIIGPVAPSQTENPTVAPMPTAPNVEITGTNGEQIPLFSISPQQLDANLQFFSERPNDVIGVTMQPHLYAINRNNPAELDLSLPLPGGPATGTTRGDLGVLELTNGVLPTFFQTGTPTDQELENFVATRRDLNQQIFLTGQILSTDSAPLSKLLRERGLAPNTPVLSAIFVVTGAYTSQEAAGATSVSPSHTKLTSFSREPQVLWSSRPGTLAA